MINSRSCSACRGSIPRTASLGREIVNRVQVSCGVCCWDSPTLLHSVPSTEAGWESHYELFLHGAAGSGFKVEQKLNMHAAVHGLEMQSLSHAAICRA